MVQAGASQKIDTDIKNALPFIVDDFTLRWGRIHRCKMPGCGDTVVADGHMDYKRAICGNQSTPEYITHDGIKSGGYWRGCTNSPSYKSRLCKECKAKEIAEPRSDAIDVTHGHAVGCIAGNAQDEVALEDSCNTIKDKHKPSPRNLTCGAFYNVWPCVICYAFRELFRSEG